MFSSSEGWRSGSDLYDLKQSLHDTLIEFEAQLKAAIESTLGHSIDALQKEPDLLRELLRHRDDEKRSSALLFLSRFDQNLPDFEQIFRRTAVEDRAPRVRSAAITVLGELGAYRHTSEIVTLLYDILTNVNEEAFVRKSAYLAMTHIDVSTNKGSGPAEFGTTTDLILELHNDDISVEDCIDADVIRRLMGPERSRHQ